MKTRKQNRNSRNEGNIPLSCSSNPHKRQTPPPISDDSWVVFHDPNKHGSGRMKKFLENCSRCIWWHQEKAQQRAERLQKELPPKYVSFVRKVQVSDDYNLFMSGYSQLFKHHQQGDDRLIVLEDECGRSFKVNFFDKDWTLSSGWKDFCMLNNLLKDDYLVFHLIQPSTFEVYVVKNIDEAVVDKTPTRKDHVSDKESPCVSGAKRPRKENTEVVVYTQNTAFSHNAEETERAWREAVNNSPDHWNALAMVKEQEAYLMMSTNDSDAKEKAPSPTIAITNTYCLGSNENEKASDLDVVGRSCTPLNVDSSMRRNEIGSQPMFENSNAQELEVNNDSLVVEHLNLNKAPDNDDEVEEGEINPFQTVIVDGVGITSQIPEKTRIKYFTLCNSQNALLHSGIPEGIPISLVLSIICETVSISHEIRACKMATPQNIIVYWETTLRAFSTLGMNLGFMCNRVNKLLEIKTKTTKSVDHKKAKVERDCLEKSVRVLESDIEEMKEKIRAYKSDIEKIKKLKKNIDDERKEAEEVEEMLKIEAAAPW